MREHELRLARVWWWLVELVKLPSDIASETAVGFPRFGVSRCYDMVINAIAHQEGDD